MGNSKYTDEFRMEAADYVIASGKAITDCAKDLGLNSKTLNDWILKRKRKLSGEPDPKAEDRELKAAKKRIRELEMENEFLKKAAAFFAREQGK